MKALAILLAVACGTLAAPRPSLRRPTCEDSESRFVPSKKYVYRYVGTSSTGIKGPTDEKAEIKIEARFHVTSVSSCVFHLEVDEVKLSERSSPDMTFTPSEGNKEFKRDLEGSPLTFTSVHGKILDIKKSKQEPVYVTNIKKGMLSALQLEFKEGGESIVKERDIAGDCKTRYLRLIKDDSKEDVYKAKNLTECTNRSDMDTLMHPVFYTSGSSKRTPMECTSVCHYKVAEKQINSVECKETHLLRPLSSNSAGVMTTVTQKIVLEKTSSFSGYSQNLQDDSSERSDLRFDFNMKKKLQESLQDDTSSVDKILRDLVEKTPSPKEALWVAPLAYTKLVFELRRLNLQGLNRIWNKFYECQEDYWDAGVCRTKEEQVKYEELIVDGLSQCGTEACVEFIVQQLRQITPTPEIYVQGIKKSMKQLLSGLMWVRNPTEKILGQVWTLLKEKDDILPDNTITILGSMIRTHCDVYPRNCRQDLSGLDDYHKVPEIARFFDNLLYMNNDICKATPETVDKIIYVIRAIGNSRYVETSPSYLVLCAVESNYKNISSVALQVLGEMKLDFDTRKELKNIYRDYKKDPEMRMMSYLAWMKEPTKDDIKTAAEVLEGEMNTQVGSLVWSHLTSMNESVEPTGGESIGRMIKDVLRNKKIRSFNMTSKSTVWHKSTFNEKRNLGLSADSHVLYHPESLLPRYVHFNLSVDVLGGAFPVLEASTRTEGLELLWDRLFGPVGHFPDNHIKHIVRAKDSRMKRSINDENELQYMHDRVNMPKYHPSGLFSIKLFDNELALFTLKDLEWLAHEVPMLDWVQELIDLKNGVDRIYTKNVLFLQDSYTIPTSIGLPLTLSLNGSAVGSVHVIAKGDLRSLFWSLLPEIELKASVKPSAAVSFSGMMSVDAFHSKIGILVNSTLFTTSNISANVTYKKHDKLKFHHNVVEKPQEIFNISSMLFKQVNNKKTPITGLKQRKKASACISSIFNVTKYVGMDLCSKISVPVSWDKTEAPLLPLLGPANLSVNLHRSDPKLTTYKVEVNSTVSKTFNKTCLELSTPGSTHKRIVLMNLTTLNTKDRLYQWNISVGDHQANWTVLNFTEDSISKTIIAGMNITWTNFSLYHATKVHKPNKIVTTNTSLLRGPYGRPVTLMFLNATFNYSRKITERSVTQDPVLEEKMIFNLTHRPLKFTWQVEIKRNPSELKTNVSCVMKCKKRRSPLLNHRMVFNITEINVKDTEKTTEKGLHVGMLINETRRMSVFGSKKVFRTNGQKMSTYFTNFTYYNRTTMKPYTTSLKFTFNENLFKKWNKMKLNMTYKDNSITLETSMRNHTDYKRICLNGTYINGTTWYKTGFKSCMAFLNDTLVKNLIWNLTALDKTHKLNATWFGGVLPEKYLLVNYTCQKKSLANFTVSYRKTSSEKFLGMQSSIGNWSLDLHHSYQDEKGEAYRLRRVLIIHKAKNRTEPYMYNAFDLSFWNSSTEKKVLVGMTLSTRTKKETLEIEPKSPRQFMNKTVSWQAEIRNNTQLLNASSLFEYQTMKEVKDQGPKLQISKKKSNHTLFWDKSKNFLNVSLDLPYATLGFNCSGTFNKGINVSANMNDSFLWNVYISERQLISNVTFWNRTVMVERRTCSKCQALFLNISTWNVVNKTAFNGSFTWYLSGNSKKTSLNVTLINVNTTLLNTTFVNTSFYFTAFSLNDSHLNISFFRRNKSELYNESSLEFRPGGRMYMEFNKTTLKRIWKELNAKSFDIPRKLLNITVSFTSRGANIKKTEKHLKILLQEITREISTWNFTQKNLGHNLSKLRMHLLNVTSQALPNVPCVYNVYAKEKKFEILKFWSHLTKAIAGIPRAEIRSRKIAKELVQSLKKISDSFNKTRVIGNLSEVLGNVVVYTSSQRATYLKNLTDDLMFFLKNLTRNITDYLKTASKDIGSWEIHSMRIDDHIKGNTTKVKDKVLYILNESEIFIREIHEHLLILRDDVAFLSDVFINETYPEVYIKDFYNRIKKMASPTAIAGGILHPWWLNVSETLKISIFNTTVHNFHKYLINKTAVEVIFPFLSQPDYITNIFHKKVLDKSLEKVMNSSMNKALEMYNVTLKLPSWHLNMTHDNVVYAKDIIVMLYNDTDNVMNFIAKKKLMVEIVEFYINQTQNVTGKTWNLTKHMMEGILNVSIPADRRWEMLKANVTELYWDTSEKMPWARPLIRWWNTTMYSLAKNNTPEKLMEEWMPKFVTFTLDKASDFTKYVNECLTDKQTQTPRIIKMGYSTKNLIISTIHKMELRPNFTKYYSDGYWYYQNFTSSIFNKTMEPKNFTYSKTTMQWADNFFNRTSRIFDFAESVINGSLANETINNLNDKYVRSSPKLMELHNWVLNSTWGRMVNKSSVIYQRVKNTLNKVHEMEAEDLAILLTPKNDTAFIINQRSYITFDKRSFRVPGFIKPGCSFLVARDFLQGQFTVLATQNSYIIMTADSKIEVYKDGRIKANEMSSNTVMTDLPVQFDDMYAIRDGPYIRVKSEDIGFEFELEMKHFIFAAYISGFYHNRTLGLLGTNNGEISDDWLSPLAKNRTSLKLFLKSWLVSGDSDCVIERPQWQCKRKDSARCDELLKSKDSPFQKCFDVVDPKAFLEACIKEVSSCETSGPKRISHCSVSAAYVRACVKNGVDISMPTQCADCYEQTRFMISKRKVDIVVIASEGTNMKQITSKIPNLVSSIDISLDDTNILRRFGLVGFSGRPPIHWRGHTHTLNGKFFGSEKELNKGIETLDFAPRALQTNISDGYMGIYHATKYPFHPGAKKIFILVTDSRRVPDSDLTSDMVSQAMKNIDAKLIVIGDYYFKHKMYGGDTDRYRYYKKSPEGMTHKNIEPLPKEDEYVKVVSKTQGAVFMVKRFEKDDKILSEMVKNVILRYSKGKTCMKCRCIPDEVGKGRDVCKATSNDWCS